MSRITIFPGQQILLSIFDEDTPEELLYTTVCTVQHRALSVVDSDSSNGLARVVCKNASKETGIYSYAYDTGDGQSISLDAKLQLMTGEKIVTDSFIGR